MTYNYLIQSRNLRDRRGQDASRRDALRTLRLVHEHASDVHPSLSSLCHFRSQHSPCSHPATKDVNCHYTPVYHQDLDFRYVPNGTNAVSCAHGVYKEAPAAIGPYSQAVTLDGLVFVSGCLGFDPKTMNFVEGGVEAQARQALTNLKAVLEASGSEMGKVAKVTVRLYPRLYRMYGY